MIVRIYEEVYDLVKRQVNSNFKTSKRYSNTLSEAEKAEKVFLLVYNQCKENHDGFHSAEIHRDFLYKITKSNKVSKNIVKKLVKCDLIKIHSEHGCFMGNAQSRKFRLGMEPFRVMNECKQKMAVSKDVLLDEICLPDFVDILDGNGMDCSNRKVSRGHESMANTTQNVNPDLPREPFKAEVLKTSFQEANPAATECITREGECITREDLEIYKYFELDHNLLWTSNIPFNEKVKLEKTITNHVPAHPSKTGKSYRISHWIHNLNSEYRKYITLFDSHIEEVWDKSCCYPSMVAILCKDKVSKTELNQYTNLVQTGDIYTEALKHSNLEITPEMRNEIKPYFQAFIQGSKKNAESLYKSDKNRWDQRKQKWIKPELIRAVMDFYKNKFNQIYDAILNWEVRESDGKKTISTECSKLEQELIQNGICKMIPCKWFTIHDAIFIRTEDKEQIKDFNFDAKFWQIAGFSTINLI